jgi:hypothetical protein
MEIGVAILILLMIGVFYMMIQGQGQGLIGSIESTISGAGAGGFSMSPILGIDKTMPMPTPTPTPTPTTPPTLYIYIGHEPSARKWTTFYGRRHRDPRSPILLTSQLSQAKNFQGDIQFIDARDLLRLLTSEERSVFNSVKPQELCYYPVLRDALLLRLISSSEKPAIVLPDHCFVQGDLNVLYELLMYPPGQGQGQSIDILFDGHGNSDYGCPIIMTTIGKDSAKHSRRIITEEERIIEQKKIKDFKAVADAVMVVAKEKEFAGGFRFWGGSVIVLDRVREVGLVGERLGGDVVAYPSTFDLLESDRRILAPLVVYPFPSGAGQVSMPAKDKWIYSVSIPTFFENDSPLTQVIIGSLGEKICYDLMNV